MSSLREAPPQHGRQCRAAADSSTPPCAAEASLVSGPASLCWRSVRLTAKPCSAFACWLWCRRPNPKKRHGLCFFQRFFTCVSAQPVKAKGLSRTACPPTRQAGRLTRPGRPRFQSLNTSPRLPRRPIRRIHLSTTTAHDRRSRCTFFLSRGHAVAAACSLTEVFLEHGATQPVDRIRSQRKGLLVPPLTGRVNVSRGSGWCMPRVRRGMK